MKSAGRKQIKFAADDSREANRDLVYLASLGNDSTAGS